MNTPYYLEEINPYEMYSFNIWVGLIEGFVLSCNLSGSPNVERQPPSSNSTTADDRLVLPVRTLGFRSQNACVDE